ncbi:hypothetical protein BHF68_11010 [Desulfuribacillus alkaliarsenatis]|uniref:Oxidoreductase molybdopterin-binding domain-containing protein n=1 Tax=Desulfuribacillus alkaliarsenatis TaxID=766136 RepID=A0A1E5FZI2_9FIRM|nr:hypothetical protein BHF68_11010 [Desulfuribacillus alkaliarsenatis]
MACNDINEPTALPDYDANDADLQQVDESVEIVYIDRNGNEHLVDLTKLPITEGAGGFKKSGGSIVGPVGFQGPLLQSLVDTLGGYTSDDALQITATDRYMMTLNAQQSQGNIAVYDHSGELVSSNGPTDVMIAFATDAEELKPGMPRIVFTGPESPLTNGHFWVRNIAEIKVVPSVVEWNLNLTGIGEYRCDRSTFESVASCHASPHPPQTFEQDKEDGSVDVYEGVALWVMLSTVDGNNPPSGHYRFNRELAEQGYTVQIYAEDGFMVELTSEEIAYNNDIILAYRMNGVPLLEEDGPLQLIGSGLPSKRHAIKNIERIELVELP